MIQKSAPTLALARDPIIAQRGGSRLNNCLRRAPAHQNNASGVSLTNLKRNNFVEFFGELGREF